MTRFEKHFPIETETISISCIFFTSHLIWTKLKALKVLISQSCLTLFNPKDCSPPGSSVHGIPQARILE